MKPVDVFFLLQSLLISSPLVHAQQPVSPNDLRFSEPMTLPGYSASELGKLEYPAIAADGSGKIYLAYDFTDADEHEGVYLMVADVGKATQEFMVDPKTSRETPKFTKPPEWSLPVRVSSVAGVEYAPAIAVAPDGVAWVAWSARREKQWEIYVRAYTNGSLGPEQRLTSNTEYDFRPAILADKSRRVWVAWERGTADKQVEIVARYLADGKWSDELSIEERPGYSYRPAIVETPTGDIWFAWDHAAGYNSDVYIRKFSRGTLWPQVRVTHHPAFDNKPALAWHDGKLWVAWATNRRGENDLGIIRYTMVRAFDGKKWYEPLSAMPGVDLTSQAETQSYEFPTVRFDPFGRLYLFTRHDHAFSASFYEGGTWSENWNLDEAAWGIRGLYVNAVWTSDTELWLARRDRKSITLQKMVRLNPKQTQLKLKPVTQVSYPDSLVTVEEKGDRGPTSMGNFKVFYGDIHVHTAYSDGSGSFDEVYALYEYIYRRDFVAITDHDALRSGDNHFSPGEWAYLKALNEIYDKPGEFVTINAYEWTHSTWSGPQDSTARIGHKNVYFRGGEESPFFNHHGSVAHDAVSLFRVLHAADAIAFPHHPPWGGMTWEDHDPDIETNYEIVSIHGANEYMGNLPIPHRGGMPGTLAQDGLEKGAVVGFVGASDSHGLYFHAHEGWREDPYKGGLTAVLLDGPLTRDNIWQALKARRNYATAGEKYYVEFSINGRPMGSELVVDEPPAISFAVKSDKMLYAYIVRNNEDRFISGKIDGRSARYRGVVDDTIAPGKNYYYLRVVYTNGTVAWSSPIWVEYRRK